MRLDLQVNGFYVQHNQQPFQEKDSLMNTKVKAKPLSQLRKEEKLRKQQRKLKKMTRAQSVGTGPVVERNLNDNVRSIQERIREGKIRKPDLNVTFEDRFVKTVEGVDLLLSDILSNIDTVGNVRTELKWDLFKTHFEEDFVSKVDTRIELIEKVNGEIREEMVTKVGEIDTLLTELKAKPTPEGLDNFEVVANSVAFDIFAKWQEAIFNPYNEIQEMIEALPAGEE